MHHLHVVSIGTSHYLQNRYEKWQAAVRYLVLYGDIRLWPFPCGFSAICRYRHTVDEHPYFLMFAMFLILFRNSINIKVNIPLIPVSILHRKIRKQTFII